MYKTNKIKIFGLALCIALCVAMFTACTKDPIQLDKPTGFAFDIATGAYSFTGTENASHYYIRAYKVKDDGSETSGYALSSEEIAHKAGTISGTLSTTDLPFGKYNVKLRTFVEDDTAYTVPDNVVLSGKVKGGQLSTPEFKYERDNADVTFTVWPTSLSNYNSKQVLSDYVFTLYEEDGTAVVSTHALLKASIEMSSSGDFSGALTVASVAEGKYKVSVKAAAVSADITASNESEKLELEVTPFGISDGKTSGYTESSGGNPGGGGGGDFEIIFPNSTTFAEGANTFSIKLGEHQLLTFDATKKATATEGSTYSYALMTQDSGAPFAGEFDCKIELKIDGSASFKMNEGGPLSAINKTGTWILVDGTITITWA